MAHKNARLLAGLMTSALFLSLFPGKSVMADSPEGKDDIKDMKQVADNAGYSMYFDEEEAQVAIKVKDSGDVWRSNPANADADTVASAYQKRQLKSQINIRYFDDNVQESTMDSYSDCVSLGAFETEYLDDGVKVTYNFGAKGEALILPEVISVERLEEFAGALEKSKSKKLIRNYTKMDPETMKEADKKENLATYPGLEKHSIYVLKSSTKDYIKEELASYLEEAGYTKEDYDFDLEDNGYQTDDNSPWFVIPITYKLEDTGFSAEVDPEAITYNEEGYHLVDVEILPYFGAAYAGTEGYIFVPDGSGALIDHDNGSVNTYTAKVYGQDVTMNALSYQKSQIDQAVTVRLPVFGEKSGDKAFFAIIEKGAAYADINASVSGRVNSYNNVYAGFQFLDYGASSLGNMVGSNSFQMYSKADFSDTYKLRYSFLSGEDSGYSRMACGYRDYLVRTGVFNERTSDSDIPFYAELIGAIDKYATILGVRYKSVTPLTTYDQALEITQGLKDSGVENLNILYSGWANGGLHGRAYTSIKEIKKLGKDLSLKNFLGKMEEDGNDVFLGTELQYTYKDKPLDGYTSLGDSPKYFDLSAVKEATYYLGSNRADKDNSIGLISPGSITKVTKEVERLSNYGAGLAIGSISYNLYTDQKEDNYIDRCKAQSINEAAIKTLSSDFGGKVLSQNANSYVLSYTSDVLDAPFDSNKSRIIDRVVPFYEMVLHGYVNYAGECLNMSDDYSTTFLKSIESGAGLYFKWIYEDNSVLKETDYDDMYSVNYSYWIDKAVEDYKAADTALGKLQGLLITDHEYIDEHLAKVTYENGTRVYVNFSKEPVTADGVTVNARNFVVVE
ncbi:MAG: hypothetical protein K6F75_13435 [Butyrivibrio sp.]|nr:hypothetical protein [Butyrivibrio sp.]